MENRMYFAGLAMQALISKMPLLDQEGTFGLQKTEEETQEIKKQVAESAWAYADFMMATENRDQ